MDFVVCVFRKLVGVGEKVVDAGGREQAFGFCECAVLVCVRMILLVVGDVELPIPNDERIVSACVVRVTKDGECIAFVVVRSEFNDFGWVGVEDWWVL